MKKIIILISLVFFTNLVALDDLPNASEGYTYEWINGKTVYTVITDSEDDDKDGVYNELLLIAFKYVDGYRYVDFSADGNFDITTDRYTITDGVLKTQEENGDWDSQKIMSVDSTKIIHTTEVSWDDETSIDYDFFNKKDAELYMKNLNISSGLKGNVLVMQNADILSFYSNMVYKENINGVIHTGVWSIENGFLIIDVTFSEAEKETVSVKFSDTPAQGVSLTAYKTQTGNSEVTETTITSISNLIDDVVPFHLVSFDDIRGKQLMIDSVIVYFFNNMTTTQNIAVEGSGSWSIEDGVLSPQYISDQK